MALEFCAAMADDIAILNILIQILDGRFPDLKLRYFKNDPHVYNDASLFIYSISHSDNKWLCDIECNTTTISIYSCGFNRILDINDPNFIDLFKVSIRTCNTHMHLTDSHSLHDARGSIVPWND